MAKYSITKERYSLDQARKNHRMSKARRLMGNELGKRIRIKVADTDLFLIGKIRDKNDMKRKLRFEAELDGMTDIKFEIKVLDVEGLNE